MKQLIFPMLCICLFSTFSNAEDSIKTTTCQYIDSAFSSILTNTSLRRYKRKEGYNLFNMELSKLQELHSPDNLIQDSLFRSKVVVLHYDLLGTRIRNANGDIAVIEDRTTDSLFQIYERYRKRLLICQTSMLIGAETAAMGGLTTLIEALAYSHSLPEPVNEEDGIVYKKPFAPDGPKVVLIGGAIILTTIPFLIINKRRNRFPDTLPEQLALYNAEMIKRRLNVSCE